MRDKHTRGPIVSASLVCVAELGLSGVLVDVYRRNVGRKTEYEAKLTLPDSSGKKVEFVISDGVLRALETVVELANYEIKEEKRRVEWGKASVATGIQLDEYTVRREKQRVEWNKVESEARAAMEKAKMTKGIPRKKKPS